MQYMGGKFRQSREIYRILRPYVTSNTVYVEPFCGGMWSATRVARELRPGKMILNDINKPLMLLWEKCLREGCDWLPEYPSREMYQWYKEHRPEDDPITAYIGFGFCFGGSWYSTYIKPGTSHIGDQRKSIYNKVRELSKVVYELHNVDYANLVIPDGAVVYCDPPYEGRTKAHHFDTFDYEKFWQWVRNLSNRCIVYTSCYECPDDFQVAYDWGDTVVRHHSGHGSDGTHEKLVRYVVKEV